MSNSWNWLEYLRQPLIGAFLVAFGASLLLTFLVIKVAHRFNLLAKPSADRWHSRSTALFGGVAIFGAAFISALLFLSFESTFLPLGIGASFIFLLGLYDDRKPLLPAHKFVAQLAAACFFVAVFYSTAQAPTFIWLVPLAIVWVVGITNAFNLLDNMDGLSAGVAVLVSILMAVYAATSGDTGIAVAALILAGAAAGFLVFNFNPARIFMGDCGSMFLGFSLACLTLMGRDGLLSGNLFSAILLPTLALATPLFDTFFVSCVRMLYGRSISQGGRDHTSHRLVLLGMSERSAVLCLYGITLWFGLLALMGATIKNHLATIAITVLSASGLLIFGIFLAEVQTYSKEEYERAHAKRHKNRTVLTRAILHKRRFAEALLDFGAICACLIGAFLLRYEGNLSTESAYALGTALPYFAAVQMISFHAVGLYNGLWRYATVSDLMTAVRGVIIGTIASYTLILLLPPTEYFPRSTLVIYAALLLIVVVGMRSALKALRHHFALKWRAGTKKVLVVGAGDAGELAVNEMFNNKALQLVPVGFLDDNPAKSKVSIHGVRVLGTRNEMLEIVQKMEVDEIIIAMPSVGNGVVKQIAETCQHHAIPYREVRGIILPHGPETNVNEAVMPVMAQPAKSHESNS